MKYLIFIFAAMLTGCSLDSRSYLFMMNDIGKLQKKSFDRVLWENAIKAEEPLTSMLLLQGDMASYHLVQVRTAEKPHRHDNHDLAVFVKSGHGAMHLGREVFNVSAGSVIFVRRTTPHYFQNLGSEPAVAIAVFSPSFDGNDVVPLDEHLRELRQPSSYQAEDTQNRLKVPVTDKPVVTDPNLAPWETPEERQGHADTVK